MDQAAVEHESEEMKKLAFFEDAGKERAEHQEAVKRLDAAMAGQSQALASAAAHRSEAAIASEKIKALLEESCGQLSQEVKNLKRKRREHLIAAEEDQETASEIQPIIDRLKIEASHKARTLMQRRYIFLDRLFKQKVHQEVTRLAQTLHPMILLEAKRRHNVNGYAEMSAIHEGDFGWVVADLVQEIRLALADEKLDPEPLSDEVKAVLELTDIGPFVPLSPVQLNILAGRNGSASVD